MTGRARLRRLSRVIAFIFADLIVLPILYVYRKYYKEGGRLPVCHLLRPSTSDA